MTHHHRFAAFLTHVLRELGWLLLALDGARVLARLGVIFAGHERPEEPTLGDELASTIGTLLGGERRQIVGFTDEDVEIVVVERGLERRPEIGQRTHPAQFTVGDLVEFPFHLRGELHVEDGGKFLDHDLLHRLAQGRREEAALFERHIASFGEHRDDRRVGGRPADAQALELLDQRGFGEARRWCREVLGWRDRLDRHRLVEFEERQRLFIFERLAVPLFARFAIEGEEAVELDDGTGGAEQVRVALRRNVEIHRGGIEHGRRHLRRHEALPDQLVELELIGGELLGETVIGTARGVGGTHTFVGVLRIGLATRIELHARGEVCLSILGLQPIARGTGRRLGDARRVGTHVRDETDLPLFAADIDAFVEILRQSHRALGAEAQLLGGFLLQRGRGERRGGILPLLAPLDLGDGELRPSLEVGEDALGFRPGGDLRLVAVDLMQLRRERLRALLQIGRDAPVLDRRERADFALALHDDTQGDRLHATGRQALLHRFPEHGAGFVADESIEYTTGLLGIDFLIVDVHRVRHGLLDLVLRDLVEHHAADRRRDGVARRLRKELLDVPADRLPFTVRVGGDEDFTGALCDPFELGEDVFLALDRDVIGGEAMLDVDAKLLGGQVTHVAHGCLHREAFAEVLADRFGLGWRLDDDQRGTAGWRRFVVVRSRVIHAGTASGLGAAGLLRGGLDGRLFGRGLRRRLGRRLGHRFGGQLARRQRFSDQACGRRCGRLYRFLRGLFGHLLDGFLRGGLGRAGTRRGRALLDWHQISVPGTAHRPSPHHRTPRPPRYHGCPRG